MSLLMDSMTQVSEGGELSPISEPDFDPVAVAIPDEGPMTFEFDIEVRPEFDLPQWKGLTVERPVHEFSDAEVDRQLNDVLARRGRLVPFDGAAQPGDYLTLNLTFQDAEGNEVSSAKEETIRIRPVLSFRDGKVERFDKLMKGVKAGETKEGEAKLTADAPNEALRGKTIRAIFEVLEVKKLEMPTLTPALLEELGNFKSEQELREAVKDTLTRRLQYEQQQRTRQQVLAALTVAADWDLPPEMLKRQAPARWSAAYSSCSDPALAMPKFALTKTSCVKTAASPRPARSRSISSWSGLPRKRKSRICPRIMISRSS